MSASTFTIPTIFSAIDKLTAPVRKMTNSVQNFATKAEGAIGRNERLFRKLTPALSQASKQFLQFASAATIVGLALGAITFSVKSIKDYETAVASFRTIVGGSDKEFSKFQDKINEVARDTKKSSIDTALAFEKIAGLNSKFAETAEGIGQVGKSAITLSKAAGDELGPSAESLVGIMNQFSFAANQADRTINVLAAGVNVGSASISQTAEAMANFGSVAAGANITLEQSVGLVQTLGKFTIFGAEAGTKLRGAILKIQKAGIGYKSGQFQINDALLEAKNRIDKLRTAKEKDAAVLKIFGAENIATGKILLSNIGLFKDYTAGVTGTNAAAESAAIRSNTLSNKLDELKARWVNMITGSSQTSAALEAVKNAVSFVADNLDTLLVVAGGVVAAFITWKAILIASRIAMVGYNIVLGVMNALDTTSVVLKSENAIAQAAYLFTTKAMTAGLWLAEGAQAALNAMMSLSPIGILIVSVTALSLAVGSLVRYYRSANVEARLNEEIATRVHEKTIDQRVEVTQLFMALRQAEKGTSAYNDILKKIDTLQPGLVDKYKLQEKALVNISAAERELTKNIMKRAEAEAKAEMLKDAIREKITLQTQGLSGMEKFATNFMSDKMGKQVLQGKIMEQDQRIGLLTNMMNGGQSKEMVTPTADNQNAMTQMLEKTNNAQVDININDPSGKAEAVTKSANTNVKTTSTLFKK